jgi:hypothetical protein
MEYEVIIDVLSKIAMALGFSFIFMLIYEAFSALKRKIKEIMKRQNKIKCLCQHEYEQKFAWRIGVTDYKEVEFKCRKCGKILKVNIVVGELGCE